MDKNKIEIQNKFDDLSECTEYYYDELGKLSAIRDEDDKSLSKKEAKKMHDYIMFFFFSAMDNLKNKAVINEKVDKVETKEFKKDFLKEHKSKQDLFKTIFKPFVIVGKKIKTLCKTKSLNVELLPESENNSLFFAPPEASQQPPEEDVETEVVEDDEDIEADDASEQNTDEDGCMKF